MKVLTNNSDEKMLNKVLLTPTTNSPINNNEIMDINYGYEEVNELMCLINSLNETNVP